MWRLRKTEFLKIQIGPISGHNIQRLWKVTGVEDTEAEYQSEDQEVSADIMNSPFMSIELINYWLDFKKYTNQETIENSENID